MRFYVIDNLRALAVINMVAYHTMFDLVYIFGIPVHWFETTPGFIWEQYICWSFILIAGFCQAFSKHGLREGFIVSFWGIIVTLVTIIVPVGFRIYYGVLTFIGAAVLITCPLKRFRIPGEAGLGISAVLFTLTRNINKGYLGFANWLKLPDFLYNNSFEWITTFLGFTAPGFSSGDYFSLFPWYFLFLSGYFLYFFLEKHNCLKYLVGTRIPVLEFISRHSLVIYLLHQPVVFAILYLLFS